MNYPFKINYKNDIAESIEYMNKDGSKKEQKSVLEFLCDYVNRADPYYMYYSYKKNGKYNDADEILDLSHLILLHFEQDNVKTDSIDSILENTSFRLNGTNNTRPLPDNWSNNKRIYALLSRFQDEIFYFDVKFNPHTGTLAFLDDPFLTNTKSALVSKASNTAYSNTASISPIDLSPLSVQLSYSPFQYQVYHRFDILCEELRKELLSMIDNKAIDSPFMSLYYQSKEFVLYHLELLLKYHFPSSLLKNSFPAQRNDLSLLVKNLPLSVEKRNYINSTVLDYVATYADFLSTYVKNNKEKLIYEIQESMITEDHDVYKDELTENEDLIKANNKLVNQLYLDNSKNEYITGIDYYYTYIDSQPTIIINSISFVNAITHDERISENVSLTLPVPLPRCYFNEYAEFGQYGTTNLDILSVIYNDVTNPLLMPIFSTNEINIQTFLQEIDACYHVNLFELTKKSYENSRFSKEPYIETDSLGMLLSEVLRTLNSSDITSIKRCSECHKFFVTRNGLDKYCDSVNRPINSSPKIGTCSYIAKQRKEKERDNCIRKIYNLKRNQLARLEEQNNNYVIRDKYEEYLYNIKFQYEEFIFFLKKNILRNYLFDKERSYIYRTLSITDSETEQKELIDYARSFFPTKRNFDKEEHHTIPTSNNHISYFYNNEKNSYLDNTHIYTFDWSEMIAKIINGQDYYHKGYIAFRNMVARTLDKNRQAFDSLDDDIIASFKYLSDLDERWLEIVNRINITNSELQKKSMHR